MEYAKKRLGIRGLYAVVAALVAWNIWLTSLVVGSPSQAQVTGAHNATFNVIRAHKLEMISNGHEGQKVWGVLEENTDFTTKKIEFQLDPTGVNRKIPMYSTKIISSKRFNKVDIIGNSERTKDGSAYIPFELCSVNDTRNKDANNWIDAAWLSASDGGNNAAIGAGYNPFNALDTDYRGYIYHD